MMVYNVPNKCIEILTPYFFNFVQPGSVRRKSARDQVLGSSQVHPEEMSGCFYPFATLQGGCTCCRPPARIKPHPASVCTGRRRTFPRGILRGRDRRQLDPIIISYKQVAQGAHAMMSANAFDPTSDSPLLSPRNTRASLVSKTTKNRLRVRSLNARWMTPEGD